MAVCQTRCFDGGEIRSALDRCQVHVCAAAQLNINCSAIDTRCSAPACSKSRTPFDISAFLAEDGESLGGVTASCYSGSAAGARLGYSQQSRWPQLTNGHCRFAPLQYGGRYF